MKTRKKTINNLLKFGVFLFGMSLLLWNCEKEFIETPRENVKIHFNKRMIKLSDVPKIENYFNKKIKDNLQSKSSTDNKQVIFDDKNVLEVIDTLNNANYSFKFLMSDSPKEEFYNLIIGRNSSGEITTPFVLKYVCEQTNIEDFLASNFDFKYFKGTVSLHKYTDYFSLNYFSRGGDNVNCPPQLDANGDPLPCEVISVNGNNSGGGTTDVGNNNTNNGNTSGGGSNCVDILVEVTCTCAGHSIGQNCTCGQNGNTGTPAYYDVMTFCGPAQKKSLRTGNDCPPCTILSDGVVGINAFSISSVRLYLKNNLTLNGTQLEWINNDNNIPEVSQIYAFLKANDIDGVIAQEAQNIAKEMINSNIIEDNIIFTNIDPCTSNILSKIKNLSTNIASIIQRFDSPNSIYNWEIKIGTPTTPNNVFETSWKLDGNGVPIPYEYITIVNPSYINQATDLAIARVFLHEAIHTYILSYVDDVINNANNSSVINNFQNNFSDVWNFYVARKNGVAVGNIEDAHHEQMANTFISIISEALSEFDNHKQNEGEFYEHLAWGALMNTDAFFSALGPNGYMTQSEQEAIEIENNQEDTNGPEAKGTPCN